MVRIRLPLIPGILVTLQTIIRVVPEFAGRCDGSQLSRD